MIGKKRKHIQLKKGSRLINVTETDLEKEKIKDMKKLVEKNAIDEDYRKDVYAFDKPIEQNHGV